MSAVDDAVEDGGENAARMEQGVQAEAAIKVRGVKWIDAWSPVPQGDVLK
jgi:hypothetical protein